MGLFSGGFGTGLAEGLAESVDQSLKSAMNKRDKELSRARQFWETRQAQKMDLADEHDARVDDALTTLINEFNGDEAKALAAYTAIGGTVDSVESYLAEVTDTRKKLGDYSIVDKINLDGLDLSAYYDETTGKSKLTKARQSFYKEVKPIDVQMQARFPGSRLLPGSPDLGAAVSEDVNSLIKARTYDEVTDFVKATLDRSGLVGTEEYAREVAAQTLAGQPKFEYNLGLLSNPDLDDTERERIQDENARILLGAKAYRDATTDTPSGTSLSELTTQYKSWRSGVEDEIGYVKGNAGQATIVENAIDSNGERVRLTETAAVDYRNKIINERRVGWVKDNLLDKDGEAVSVDASAYITGHQLGGVVKQIKADIAQSKEEGAEPEAETITPEAVPQAASDLPFSQMGTNAEEAGFTTNQDVLDNPARFAAFIVENVNPNITEQELFDKLTASPNAKPPEKPGFGVPPDQMPAILENIRNKRELDAGIGSAAEAERLKIREQLFPSNQEVEDEVRRGDRRN